MCRKRQTCPSTGLGGGLGKVGGLLAVAGGRNLSMRARRERGMYNKQEPTGLAPCFCWPSLVFFPVVFLCFVCWLVEVCTLPQRVPDVWSCPTGTGCGRFGRQRGERKMGWCQTRCPDASRMRHSAVSEGAL